jgi:hypothetical protein
MTKELPIAIDRERRNEATIVPLVVEHCDLEALPIWTIQALPLDEDGRLRPLKDWQRQHRENEALADVARKLRVLIGEAGGSAATADTASKGNGYPERRRARPFGAIFASALLLLLAIVGWASGPFRTPREPPMTPPRAEYSLGVGESLIVDPLDLKGTPKLGGLHLVKGSVRLAPGSPGAVSETANEQVKYDTVAGGDGEVPRSGDVAKVEYWIADEAGQQVQGTILF